MRCHARTEDCIINVRKPEGPRSIPWNGTKPKTSKGRNGFLSSPPRHPRQHGSPGEALRGVGEEDRKLFEVHDCYMNRSVSGPANPYQIDKGIAKSGICRCTRKHPEKEMTVCGRARDKMLTSQVAARVISDSSKKDDVARRSNSKKMKRR